MKCNEVNTCCQFCCFAWTMDTKAPKISICDQQVAGDVFISVRKLPKPVPRTALRKVFFVVPYQSCSCLNCCIKICDKALTKKNLKIPEDFPLFQLFHVFS